MNKTICLSSLFFLAFLQTNIACASEFNDPTRPLSYKADSVVKKEILDLQAIFVNENGSEKVIINGKLMKAGEKVSNWMVKEIRRDHVFLVSGQMTKTLSLRGKVTE